MSETRDERRTLGRHGHHATFDPGCLSCWRIEATKRGDDGRELSDLNRALQKELDALGTQLQQAEQERDIALASNQLQYEAANKAESQLQQAETALASFREAAERTLQDIHNGEANSTGAQMLDAALAAPPPNPAGRPPECGGGAFTADSTETTDPAPPPNTKDAIDG